MLRISSVTLPSWSPITANIDFDQRSANLELRDFTFGKVALDQPKALIDAHLFLWCRHSWSLQGTAEKRVEQGFRGPERWFADSQGNNSASTNYSGDTTPSRYQRR